MSNRPVHCSSCTLGVGRSRSVKFAPVRTRWKGGGACELSSAELPFIRRFALPALHFAGSRQCVWRTRVCIIPRDRVVYASGSRLSDRSIALIPRDWRASHYDRSGSRDFAGETFRSHRQCVSVVFHSLKIFKIVCSK